MSDLDAQIRALVDEAVTAAVGGRAVGWISVERAADELGISARALRARIARGWIDRNDVSKTGRRLFVRVAALNRRLEDSAG